MAYSQYPYQGGVFSRTLTILPSIAVGESHSFFKNFKASWRRTKGNTLTLSALIFFFIFAPSPFLYGIGFMVSGAAPQEIWADFISPPWFLGPWFKDMGALYLAAQVLIEFLLSAFLTVLAALAYKALVDAPEPAHLSSHENRG